VRLLPGITRRRAPSSRSRKPVIRDTHGTHDTRHTTCEHSVWHSFALESICTRRCSSPPGLSIEIYLSASLSASVSLCSFCSLCSLSLSVVLPFRSVRVVDQTKPLRFLSLSQTQQTPKHTYVHASQIGTRLARVRQIHTFPGERECECYYSYTTCNRAYYFLISAASNMILLASITKQ
jgi:hypothetical protein